MELIRGLHNLRARHHGCVLTIGNFDGVHLGHQRILERLREQAQRRGLPATLMLFEPQPAEFFAPEQAPARLMPLRDKVRALASAGIDRVLCVRFDASFRAYSAERFISELLLEGLGTHFLVVGDDFRFGAGREGDFDLLRRAGEQEGFEVEDTPTCTLDGERVSSTRVREALADNDLERAAAMLGGPYRISGRVRHGDELGRTLGVPTANLALRHPRLPIRGVYAVRVHGAGDRPRNAVANVGRRPTVEGERPRLEVHLLDYSGDLYRRHLEVELLHFLRDEQKFDGLDALREAIHNDIDQARHWFAEQS